MSNQSAIHQGNGSFRQPFAGNKSTARGGPTPMEVDTIMRQSRGAPGVLRCRRCTGIGHLERNCPTRADHPALNRGNETRRTITNLEISENGDACVHMSRHNDDIEETIPGGEYCGYIDDGEDHEHLLPSYRGLLAGRPCHFLVDSGATGNFVAS